MLARTVSSTAKTVAVRRSAQSAVAQAVPRLAQGAIHGPGCLCCKKTMTLQLRLMSSVAVPDNAAELAKEVADTTQLWMDTVTSGKDDAPAKTASLYAKDAAFWPTVSTELRVEPQEVSDYFEYFARVPGLKVVPGSYKPYIRTFGDDVATNDGYFTFRADDPSQPNGEKVIPARFTFVYRKNDKNEWEIINHHNSVMPTPPAALKPGYAHLAPKY